MDHQRAIIRLRSREVLSAALDYAVFDRIHGDFFYDPLEIEYALANRDTLISELIEELQDPGQFRPRRAFAYFPPKNELCDRRMIYILIKDLIVRYAIAILFAEQIETEIHPQCFANRRASGDEARVRFTEDFSTGGWARFCQWQSERSNDNAVLLRTDISSFYDSVSHEYLIDAVCRHLSLPKECALVSLLRRLLQIPVIYYLPSTGEIEGPETIHQGLPIGDGVEGYLTNIHLKDVDVAMIQANAAYGRYVDDMRLFGNSRQEVLQNLRIFQEQLLRKGLNLNSSKTEIAEDQQSRDLLMSRVYVGGDYVEEEDEKAGSVIAARIDQPFEQFSRIFAEGELLTKASDAKEFCKFLGAHSADGLPLVALGDRKIWHVERLREVIMTWRGPTKHAGWLLVQTAIYRGVSEATRNRAREVVLELLKDKHLNAYSRYRILHHLVKPRRRKSGETSRFIVQLTDAERQQIEALIPKYLSEPALELNLIALYTSRVLGGGIEELKSLAATYCRSGCEPIRNVLEAVAQIPETSPLVMAITEEPDAVPERY